MTLDMLDELYGVTTEKWMEDGKATETEVQVIEMMGDAFIGWYSEGPFIVTIHIKAGEVKTLTTEV